MSLDHAKDFFFFFLYSQAVAAGFRLYLYCGSRQSGRQGPIWGSQHCLGSCGDVRPNGVPNM